MNETRSWKRRLTRGIPHRILDGTPMLSRARVATMAALVAAILTGCASPSEPAVPPKPEADAHPGPGTNNLTSRPTPIPPSLDPWSSSSDPQMPGLVGHGPRNIRHIALTFDADMTYGMKRALETHRVASYDNTRIYAILERERVKATFFLSGLWIERYPEETRALANNPLFELENHSYSHPAFFGACFGLPRIEPGAELEEMLRTKILLENITHRPNRFFRFPGGCYSQADLNDAHALGLTVVDWDVVGGDGGQNNPQVIINNVLRNVRDGSIIVLHSHGGPKVPATQDALPTILKALKSRGFTFVKLSELLQ